MTTPRMTETSGSDQRDSRIVEVPLATFDLADELHRLAGEPDGNDQHRATATLARTGPLRLVLSRIAAGSDLGGRDGDAALAIVVLDGRIEVSRGGETQTAGPDQVVLVDGSRPWRAVAHSDAALLIAVASADAAPATEATR